MNTVGIVVHDVPGRTEILAMTQDCINTLEQTADEPYQLILVDNGSRTPVYFDYIIPKTSELVRKGIECIARRHEDNLPVSAVWNKIIDSGMGDVIMLLNNDVVFNRPGWMSTLSKAANEPGVGIAGSKSMSWNGFSFLEGAFLAFRKDIALSVAEHGQVFDEQFVFTCEDADFCHRLQNSGYRLVETGIEANGYVRHLHHGTLSWMTHDGVSILDTMHDSRKKLCRKYGMAERVND